MLGYLPILARLVLVNCVKTCNFIYLVSWPV